MNRIKGSIFFSVFVAMLGLMLIAPIMPPLIRELGLRESHSGIIISLGSITMALMAPVWGNLSDAKGRKPVILLGFIGMCVSCLLFTLTLFAGLKGWLSGGLLLVLLIVTRGLIGGFIPAVLSSSQAYMGDVTEGEERGSGMAIISAANGLGLVFGPAIAGAFTLIGLLWPLYFGIVIAAVAFVVSLLAIPAAQPVIQQKPARINPLQPGLRMYLFAGLVTMISIVTIQVIGGFYFQDQLGLTSEETARVVSFGLMFSGAAMLIVQIIQMKWLKWQPKPMILLGSLFLIAGMAFFLISASWALYYAAFFMFGIGTGLLMPGFMAGASLSVSQEQQGGAAGLVAAIQGISAIIAPILTTTLYRVDKYIPFILIAVLVACMAIVMLGVKKGDGNSKPVPDKA
ncbi:MFS family permease [Paenibacillus jamilae]|jgi:DHA1 family multidrug resistance protein-like MFS transporter|uniref:MFS transporter n=1 Tax=Paenibacillus TaxID=44249 RepID=UPI000D322679|nr:MULTISPECIES: MFS transporter [Paenibacillus]KAF6615040.1 MFS transporter [Paenibacillus sp. EKM101P]KAF6622239.1 MFS transporter [Paenibacillus sp. EKM102P]KAF6631211.1 MFS transporter [Paenibacillus sp. EKM10P]KAF6650262.1 MFS transporter [Paenibacillus sp. EKM11P]MBY0022796.1 MFS transporter [Paenibacillus polymyxa]